MNTREAWSHMRLRNSIGSEKLGSRRSFAPSMNFIMHLQIASLIAFCLASSLGANAATPDTSGDSARATISVQATVPKGQLAVAGQALYERRGSLLRIDIQQLSITGPAQGATARNPLPPGGYVIVVDATTRAYTMWSPSKRMYYTGQTTTPTPSPSATATPAATKKPSGTSVSSVLASLKDLRQFVVSLSLSPDKTPIQGHPTTNFDFRFTRQVKNQDPVDVIGRASFADDLGGIPLLVTFTARGGTGGKLSANVRVALSDVKQQAPPQSDFVPPAGYVRASSIFDVITLPSPPPKDSSAP